MPELKVGALTYGAFLSMVLPPPVVWKDLGLVNSMDEPFSEENCIDLRNNLIYRTVADKVDMLRANFPGETVEHRPAGGGAGHCAGHRPARSSRGRCKGYAGFLSGGCRWNPTPQTAR